MRGFVEFWKSRIVLRVDEKYRIPLLYVLVLLFFFLWIFYDVMIGSMDFPVSDKVIEANIAILKGMEEKAPPDIANIKSTPAAADSEKKTEDFPDKQAQSALTKEENPSDGAELFQAKEQKKIMTMDNPDMSIFNQWFDGCAVLGDSLAEGAGEYGFLNSSILFAEIGCSVTGAGDLVDSMKKMYPRKIFLAFGSNDLEKYGADADRFTEHYREMVSEIQSSLPDAQIYVAAILPIQQKAVDKEPKRKNVRLYNEKLKELCDMMELTFLDPGFILEQDSSLYEPDGIHAVKNFYYKWLTYLADMAGVSG